MAGALLSAIRNQKSTMLKTIVIGLGNSILGDDGVGCLAADALRERPEAASVEIDTLAVGGISLMERMIGFERAIVIDAISTGGSPTGSVTCFPLEALGNAFAGHLGSAHDTSLLTALEVGRTLGAELPKQVSVVAIESPYVFDFSTQLSPEVASAIPAAVQAAVELFSEIGGVR
jgi:hydrogenase maturation protease